MVCDKCNYFSFWAIFCLFTPLTAQTIKILKKWKIHLEISFYIYVRKIMTRWCMVPEILLFLILGSKFWKNEKYIWRYYHFIYMYLKLWPDDAWFLRYYFSFWDQNFEKMKKKPGDISKNYVFQKLWSDDVQFLRYAARRTDRGCTDGKRTYRGGCPTQTLLQ